MLVQLPNGDWVSAENVVSVCVKSETSADFQVMTITERHDHVGNGNSIYDWYVLVSMSNNITHRCESRREGTATVMCDHISRQINEAIRGA